MTYQQAAADHAAEFPAYDRPLLGLTECSYASCGLTKDGRTPATRAEVVQVLHACLVSKGLALETATAAKAQTEVSLRERLAAAYGALPVYEALHLGQGAYADEKAVQALAFDLFTQWRYGCVASR